MFLPSTIDLSQSEKYILSIRIEPDGLMFSISDPENGKNYCLRETSFITDTTVLNNIKRIIFEISFLTLEFKEANVIIVSDNYDIIPDEYYDRDKKNKLYNLTHFRSDGKLLTNRNQKQNSVTLFSIDEDIYDFLSRNLCNPRFFHHTNLLVDYFSEKGKVVSMGSKMFVNFGNGLCDILCYTNSRLIHCMTIKEEQGVNQLYYILKAWEQSGFDQLQDYIYTVGLEDEKLSAELHKYVKNTEQISAPSEVFLWNEEALKAPLDILSLSL